MAQSDLQNEIEQAAKEPRQVTGDGGSVSAQPIRDLLDADVYIEGTAVVKKKKRGLLVAKFKPPGCQ